MANPAPIIIELPSFDVTVGTTIDFNIIGGTNIVRSNKVYIYDMDNNLILSHLYADTQSIHELPPNTDASMVYASGKDSSYFKNQARYYLTIQTFTDDVGTTGGSGISTAKTFYGLPTPSLTLNTIESPINITSCEFTAVYNSNITNSDIQSMNTIQQYKFDLYKITGDLIQTTGWVFGSGEQVDASTEYHISHNFTGLENNNIYYVVTHIISTSGMYVSTPNSIDETPPQKITVSFVAPTLGSAIVKNHPCDGYISIESTLGDEYADYTEQEFETLGVTKILVKRLDREDTTATWLTLFSIDVENASDMNFIVVDFYNCYGREYQYALVPIMVQNQGTELEPINVEVEGNYTISNIVKSVFDGVFIADNTAIQKLQANVGYNSINRRQSIGVIETLGHKYPIIVSNNNIDYHSGDISAMILHNGFYSTKSYFENVDLFTSNNNLIIDDSNNIIGAFVEIFPSDIRYSRTELVKARKILTSFLTNKSPKILKDWNGNIWLVMFTSDISLSFTNEWGMGIASFDASWTEIGSAEDQHDLQDSGLIDIGGV